MYSKNSTSPKAFVTLAAAAALLLSVSCKDDFGYQNIEGQSVAFSLDSPDTWHGAMAVDKNEPTTHCTSIRPMTGEGTALYLHTVVAEQAAVKPAVESRGTPLTTLKAFQDLYSTFSLSGICYTGTYPEDKSQNHWTTEYAYNLNYSTSTGKPAAGGRELYWPANGRVRFFAFAPTVDDFIKMKNGGSLAISPAEKTGSPTITYTVPSDVTEQIDLMTVNTTATGATNSTVNLQFKHALTAVKIKCGSNMLAGKITEVTIKGVYGTGTQVIGSDKWTIPEGTATTEYSIKQEINLPSANDKDATKPDKVHTPADTPIAGTDTDNLTFMLIPQKLEQGAEMIIKFTDKATNTERTISGSLAGQTWEAGKVVCYVISPSSINVSVKVELSKKGITNTELEGDTIPYSGVWYDVTSKAWAEIVQTTDGTTNTKKIEDIPADKINFQYKIGENTWTDCTRDETGLLTIAPQPAYKTMRDKFTDKGINIDTESGTTVSLSAEHGEPANCYLVDRPGSYSLDLVYGNGKNLTLPAGGTGLQYFPGYDNQRLPENGIIAGASDAVLLWQDAPDLIDPESVGIESGKLVFKIRKHTLNQGNAVLAVRKDEGGKKVIIWSWHIWVTPYKSDFYNLSCTSTTYLNMTTKTDKLRDYKFANYNLGWCDSHEHNSSRKFSLQAVVDMSAYGGKSAEEVTIPGEFTQMEYRGSDAGDNTYYQWGRKDPMAGGIRNDHTPLYTYKQKGTTWKPEEFNMENKPLFNQYYKDGYDYRFRKNVGDKLTELKDPEWGDDGNSHGVWIGYTIQHPYMFITNSRMQYVDPSSGKKEGGDPPQTDLEISPDFNFRGHWHKPWALEQAPYLVGSTDHIMFNAWDAGALNPGKLYSTWGTNIIKENLKDEYLATNASDVLKTVFDPCPPKFKMPPVDAFRGATAVAVSGNTSTITFGTGGSTDFPVTGIRDYALRSNEWTTVIPAQGDATNFDYKKFYRTTMPAFGEISFVSTATLVLKDQYNRYQLFYFGATNDVTDGLNKLYDGTSSNSYGMSVRPIRDE